MKLIGLTGGVACGKSTVALQFAERGFPIIDTDLVVRELSEHDPRVRQALQREFGTTDRAKLRQVIFQDATKRRALEKLLHPRVEEVVLARTLDLRKREPVPRAAVVVVPLLFEANWQKHFDFIVAILSDEAHQVSRLTRRDGISEEFARRMISAQIPNQEKAQKAGYAVWNNGTPEELRVKVAALIEEISKKF
ncbi:MAG: dephospho-CoA kinase [Pseudomonadota bacterium]